MNSAPDLRCTCHCRPSRLSPPFTSAYGSVYSNGLSATGACASGVCPACCPCPEHLRNTVAFTHHAPRTISDDAHGLALQVSTPCSPLAHPWTLAYAQQRAPHLRAALPRNTPLRMYRLHRHHQNFAAGSREGGLARSSLPAVLRAGEAKQDRRLRRLSTRAPTPLKFETESAPASSKEDCTGLPVHAPLRLPDRHIHSRGRLTANRAHCLNV